MPLDIIAEWRRLRCRGILLFHVSVESQPGRQEGDHGDQWRVESARGYPVLRGVTVPRDRHVVGERILSKLWARRGDFSHPWREWPTRNLHGWREDF